MRSLREHIYDADNNQYAIGHFNIATIDMLWAVLDARALVSAELGFNMPVIIGVSEGERDFFGIQEIALIIKNLRENHGVPVFLNADHTYSIERCKEAIDVGFDMVIIDKAKDDYETNLTATCSVVEYRNQVKSSALVEAELGYIGGGSDVKDTVPEGVGPETMTDLKLVKSFVADSGIDLLAPSIGNIHGMVKSGNPALDPEHSASVRKACGIPMVLHGGSGSSDDDFRSVIKNGISIIHISTELRLAYHMSLKEMVNFNETITPYKYLAKSKQAVQEIVEDRIRLFSMR